MEIVPIERAAMEDRTILEWDKDDIEALGMLKIDLLSLGMLTAIRKSIDLVNGDRASIALGATRSRLPDAPSVRPDLAAVSPAQDDAAPAPRADATPERPEPLVFHSIPTEDPATYDMICKADTVGVFHGGLDNLSTRLIGFEVQSTTLYKKVGPAACLFFP
jgi:error-prone DNA polymerase